MTTEAELKAQHIADLVDSVLRHSEADTPEIRAEIVRLLQELGAEVGQAVAVANKFPGPAPSLTTEEIIDACQDELRRIYGSHTGK